MESGDFKHLSCLAGALSLTLLLSFFCLIQVSASALYIFCSGFEAMPSQLLSPSFLFFFTICYSRLLPCPSSSVFDTCTTPPHQQLRQCVKRFQTTLHSLPLLLEDSNNKNREDCTVLLVLPGSQHSCIHCCLSQAPHCFFFLPCLLRLCGAAQNCWIYSFFFLSILLYIRSIYHFRLFRSKG